MSRSIHALLAVLLSRRTRALLSIGMVAGISVVGTLALWSSTSTTQSGAFTTATINILAGGSKASSFTFAPTGITPGQSAAQVVTVSNTGSAALTYTASVASTSTLGQAVRLTAVAGASATDGVCGSGTTLTSNKAITSTASAFATGRGPVAATSGTDALCLQLTLPSTVTTLGGTQGTVVFSFAATAGT